MAECFQMIPLIFMEQAFWAEFTTLENWNALGLQTAPKLRSFFNLLKLHGQTVLTLNTWLTTSTSWCGSTIIHLSFAVCSSVLSSKEKNQWKQNSASTILVYSSQVSGHGCVECKAGLCHSCPLDFKMEAPTAGSLTEASGRPAH